MFRRLWFYLSYAARSVRRGARWSVFAIFCIGAGVATVVALRGLGLSIRDSLLANLRAVNRGDLTVTVAGAAGGLFSFNFIGAGDDDVFPQGQLERIRAWTAANGGRLTEYKIVSNFQLTAVDAVTVGRPQFINLLLINPVTFPLTSDDPANPMPPILALDPPGVPINQLLRQVNDVIISQNLAQDQGLRVGDTVRISGTTDLFTVRGIAPTDAESSLRNPFAALFGFAYIHIGQAQTVGLSRDPSAVSMIFPTGADLDRLVGDFFAQGLGQGVHVQSVTRLLKQNAVLADYLGRFIVIMGLGALLIGGVGIINTMLVMVGRRTTEIAALKTFGLKGQQIALLFLAEALLLGALGSVVGCILGTLLTGVVNRYGELFLQQQLVWRVYPEAIAFGMILGLVVTLVFGVLPVLTANRVRPASILRPNETVIPTAGCLHSLIALLLVVVVIGIVAGWIIGGGAINVGRFSLSSELIGIVGVAITLLILGILVGVMWLVVWLVSKLPSFGWVDLRLALRNLTARRIRTATTLLALSAGMFALSSIALVGAGAREIVNFQLTQTLGGNVLVFPLFSVFSQPLAQAALNLQLAGIDGVSYRTQYTTRSARIVSIDGVPYDGTMLQAGSSAQVQVLSRFVPLVIRDSDNPGLRTGSVIEGRDLTLADRGQRVMVISGVDSLIGMPIFPVGSQVVLEIDGVPYAFTVVGHTGGSGLLNFGQYHIPPGVLPNVPSFRFTILNVELDRLNPVLLRLSENPLIFVLDITFIDNLLQRLIAQFSALPTLVGLLSLLAAGMAMANTVSLATLERRRQIGILKAVGLKRGRVLRVLILENTLIGLLGGGIGIGLSALGAALLTWIGQGSALPIPREALPIAALLLLAAVLIAWLATYFSARAAANEKVAVVLRYE